MQMLLLLQQYRRHSLTTRRATVIINIEFDGFLNQTREKVNFLPCLIQKPVIFFCREVLDHA